MKRRLPPEVAFSSLLVALDVLEEVVPQLASCLALERSDMYGLDRHLARVKAILGSRATSPDIRPARSRMRRKKPPISTSGALFPDLM